MSYAVSEMIKRPALFLDRDGVINVDHGYVCDKESIDFVDGIFDICKAAQDLGYMIFIITNQSGIGRGYYTQEQFINLSTWMESLFLRKGVKIDKTYFCPHHIDADIEIYKQQCFCRKPNPGMINKASVEYNLDIKNSILIGDKISDISAGIAGGIKKNFMFVQQDSKDILQNNEVRVIKNLREIIKYM